MIPSDEHFAVLLRERLATSTDHLTAPVVLAERTAAGGRRRLRRRRTAAGGAIAALVAVVALPVLAPGPTGRAAQMVTPAFTRTENHVREEKAPPGHDAAVARAAEVLAGPARGDLADDRAYTQAVLAEWTRDRGPSWPAATPGRPSREDPRVVWAGHTPAGPAAVISQLYPDLEEPFMGVFGVDAAGRPRLVTTQLWWPEAGTGIAWFVDPARTVLTVLDLGTPMGFAPGYTYSADGRGTVNLTPLEFRDGAASVRLKTSVVWNLAIARLPHAGQDGITKVWDSDEDYTPPASWLPWGGPGSRSIRLAGADVTTLTDPASVLDRALTERTQPFKDGLGTEARVQWAASGRLPDGRDIIIADNQLGDDPSHLFALLTDGSRTEVIHAGEVDRDAVLPVQVRLPGQNGWAVAQQGAALAWRAGSADAWTVAGPDAALLPPQAAQVQVTRGGRSDVVALSARR